MPSQNIEDCFCLGIKQKYYTLKKKKKIACNCEFISLAFLLRITSLLLTRVTFF